jgi:hypothetical protein
MKGLEGMGLHLRKSGLWESLAADGSSEKLRFWMQDSYGSLCWAHDLPTDLRVAAWEGKEREERASS